MTEYLELKDVGYVLMTAGEYRRRDLRGPVHHFGTSNDVEGWARLIREYGHSRYTAVRGFGDNKFFRTEDDEYVVGFPVTAWVTAPTETDPKSHYTVAGVPEAWEVIEALQPAWPEDVRYHVGNVLKYVFRLGRKQGASVESDLEKIRNYADRALKVLAKGGGK